ncbi:MAG: cytochrome b/b6 domain-containing protein [Paracoccaceae bacterium]
MFDQTTKPEGIETIRLWDPALRLFHWALVVCVVAAWLLGRFGPSIMTLHFYFGYAVLALLAFRVIWGLFGPTAARFSHFLYGPGTTLRYMARIGRREPSYWPGHNPVGALSVFVLLAVLIAQALTGLFADPDDFINVGPLADSVSRDTALAAAGWHYRLSLAVLALVVLHVSAVAFYRLWKREDLVRPMITGRKAVRRDR